jgi:basic membrane protein A and related proteins
LAKRKYALALSALLAAGTLLGACGTSGDDKGSSDKGGEKEDNFTVAMVTDTGGVDDKSFNQSAWKGIQDFGKENGLEKGDNGFDYLQSASDADYETNLNQLVRREFDIVFGIGFLLQPAIEKIAAQQTDAHLAIIDAEVDAPNVASVLFKEQEGGFLAGVTAALMTKTGKVGFVGGMDIPVINRFEAGFLAGVEAVNPDIKVDSVYTGEFSKAELGKSTANRMYGSGVDIIFHAAGATGNGVFTEAKERKAADPNANVWVIGVDSDQYAEGQVDDKTNVTLTSALKRVDLAVQTIANEAKDGNFPAGTSVYGIAEEMIGLADSRGAIPADVQAKIDDFTQKVKDGEIEVPEAVK